MLLRMAVGGELAAFGLLISSGIIDTSAEVCPEVAGTNVAGMTLYDSTRGERIIAASAFSGGCSVSTGISKLFVACLSTCCQMQKVRCIENTDRYTTCYHPPRSRKIIYR